MNLQPYVDSVREQLITAAANSGNDSRETAQRMTATIDAALRLALLEALAAAADEITLELAPGSVEVRLRGREPEFAVSLPTPEPIAQQQAPEIDESGSARITLRLSDSLKQRIEDVASGQNQSVNAWIVRTLSAATDKSPRPRFIPVSGQSYTGWVH